MARLRGKAVLGLAAVASFQVLRRPGPTGGVPRTCHCEVRLWGPSGTQGRSASEAARAAASPSGLTRTGADQIEDFVREGPLYKKLLLQGSPPVSSEWLRHGEVLAERLGGSASALPGDLDTKVARRIYHFYLPLYYWMRHQIMGIRAARELRGDTTKAICFGVSAPQGCGKTTTVNLLQELFRADELSCESVSIDDFYLPASWQEVVSETYADNPLMQTRGNAGTHDVQLGTQTLGALRSEEEAEVPIPRYDKSARAGQGDRFPTASWGSARTPCDVLLVEGWMLGFKPTDPEAAARVHPGLRLVNEKLEKYEAWDELIDAFCVLAVEDLDQVYTWRAEAEKDMKRTTGSGMDAAQVRQFVANYMPAYTAYRHALYGSAASAGVDGKPSLLCWVGPDRLPYDE